MKTLKMLVLVVAITFSSAISASTNPIKKSEPNEVTETIGKLLKNPDFQLSQDTKAIVQIAINQNDEMVVLSVETKSKAVEDYIKGRLNYKKVDTKEIGYSRSFKLPVTILKSN
ncbi:hypothetical protein [Winogradskyella sp.]|uniref:hypothetical protein n=1 Tax=Winogradskyella sp. TaxID=1883156 RepID=UPI0032261C2A